MATPVINRAVVRVVWLVGAAAACSGVSGIAPRGSVDPPQIDSPEAGLPETPDSDLVNPGLTIDSEVAPKVGTAWKGPCRAFVLESGDPEVPGPAASGEPGDIRLDNEHIVVVIRGAGRRGTLSDTGGMVLDVAPRGGRDGLGEIVPVFDPDGRRLARIASVAVEQSGAQGGPAIVRAHGVDPHDDKVIIDIDYVLAPGARELRIMTTVENRGRSHYRQLAFGRLIKWGTLLPFAPGHGVALAGERTQTDWIGGDGGVGRGASLLVGTRGGLIEGVHGRDWTLAVGRREYLRPGATLVDEARLVVGTDTGIASAVSGYHGTNGTLVGVASGHVIERGARKPVRGAWVDFFDVGGRRLNRARTDVDGRFRATLVPGRYSAIANAPGRAPSAARRFRAGVESESTFALSLTAPAQLDVEIRDEAGAHLPARMRLVGVDGTPDPVLGALNDLPAARNFVVAADGRVQQPVPPGRYAITVGAGPVYGVRTERVTLASGRVTPLRVRLPRHMKPEGWFSLDPHVHTLRSSTSSTSLEARLDTCRAEGVDAVVVIDDAGLSGLRVPSNFAGSRPTVFQGVTVQVPEVGRFAAWPLGPGIDDRDFGRHPAELMKALASLPGRPLVAVLGPRARRWGYFDRYRFDPAQTVLPRGFSLDFDALEIGVSRSLAQVEQGLGDYYGLVSRGVVVAPVGGSRADTVADDVCGLPRTWVRGPPPVDDAALAAAMRRGDVAVSYGPHLDVEVGGARPGGTAIAASRYAVRVRVRAAAWARPDTLDLVVDGHTWLRVPLGDAAPAGIPLDVTRQFTLPADAGGWVIVRVDGAASGEAAYGRPVRPLAWTAAVRLGGVKPPASP